MLYGLGYLVWSYNAWRNHLGQLPAIEFQYVMSGLIPAAIMLMAWAGTTFFSRMRDKAVGFSEKHRRLYLMIAVLVVLLMSIIPVVGSRWLKPEQFVQAGPLLAVMLYLMLLTHPAFLKRSPSRYLDWFLNAYKYFTALMFSWFSLLLYVNLYQWLPQELGGPRPRCAYIDLVRQDIAPSSLSALVPSRPVDAATDSQSKVVRSNKLNVYFSSNDYLLVRTATHAKDASSADLKNAPLYELRKEVIRLVQWCPE